MSRVAVITGASKGLGFTLAEHLASRGDTLIVTARHEGPLKEAAQRLGGQGAKVIPVAGDVRDAEHRHAVIAAAQGAGGLDLLVNNASTLGPSPMPPLAQYPLEALREVYETNVMAPLALVQEALPLLRERGGLVVNISSDAAIGGYEGWGGYGSSKAALDLISKTLAAELAEDGVGVVAVDPGDMRTEMHQAAFPGEDISDRPLPEVTVPFWVWLLEQDPARVSGQRFGAQAETWEVPS